MIDILLIINGFVKWDFCEKGGNLFEGYIEMFFWKEEGGNF